MMKVSAPHPVVEALGVHKSYGQVKAVQAVDLRIQRGEAVALLGPNGAGKTTLVEMLEGLLEPDEGEIKLFGLPWNGHAAQLRQRLGLCLQETRLPECLRVDETLDLFRAFHGLSQERGAEVLSQIRLEDKRPALTSELSGGQRQRLALGLALLAEPELLLLDEPTTGLDPQARQEIWSLIHAMLRRGHTLLLTTHYMEEAEALCRRVVFMSQGRLLQDEKLLAFKSQGRRLDDLFLRPSGGRLHD